MRLKPDERRKLIHSNADPMLLWRWEDPSVETPKRVSIEGETYTVVSVDRLRRRDMTKYQRSLQRYVLSMWPEGCEHTWCVTMRRGDWTDDPRWLTYSGSGADYTYNSVRAMAGEPEAVSDAVLAQYAANAEPFRLIKQKILAAQSVEKRSTKRAQAWQDRICYNDDTCRDD